MLLKAELSLYLWYTFYKDNFLYYRIKMKPQNMLQLPKGLQIFGICNLFLLKYMKTYRIVPHPNVASKFKSVLRLTLFPLN